MSARAHPRLRRFGDAARWDCFSYPKTYPAITCTGAIFGGTTCQLLIRSFRERPGTLKSGVDPKPHMNIAKAAIAARKSGQPSG